MHFWFLYQNFIFNAHEVVLNASKNFAKWWLVYFVSTVFVVDVLFCFKSNNTAEVTRREAEIVLEQLRSVIIVNRSARIISDFRSLFSESQTTWYYSVNRHQQPKYSHLQNIYQFIAGMMLYTSIILQRCTKIGPKF